MNKYRATNYGMGRAVATKIIEASTPQEAARLAEKQMTGAHGLPGTARESASKSRVIGIALIPE